MAESGESLSQPNASEEIFNSECFNCSQNGKHVEAAVFCVECGDYLCADCLNIHNMMARMKTHQILDQSAVKPGTMESAGHPPTEKCINHHGRLIDTYCEDHDAVCCSVCVSIDHSMCKSKCYIPTVAAGISISQVLQDTQKTALDCQEGLDNLKMMEEKNLDDIRTSKAESLARTNLHKEKMIKYIEELAENTEINIAKRYGEVEEIIKSSLEKIVSVAEALEKINTQLQKPIDNATKLFVHLKQCKQILTTTEQLGYQAIFEQEMLTFEIDDRLEAFLQDLNCLGSITEKSVYSAEDASGKNIKSSDDTKICRISGICSLTDGGLIVVDHENECVKRLDRIFRIQTRLAVPGRPYDVCQTSSTEFAVTLYHLKKVQFVQLDQTMALGRSFPVRGDSGCLGITYHDDKLFVCKVNPGSIQVYDMTGTLLQTVQGDQTWIEYPVHISLNPCSSNIYIADINKGLITLDNTGNPQALINDLDLTRVRGVCNLPGDQMLACGSDSHNVMQFDGKGKKIKTLLTSADGIKHPETLHVDKKNSRLIVGMYESDVIKVYKLIKQLSIMAGDIAICEMC